jgi:ligand-binding sensor domain-containing protein
MPSALMNDVVVHGDEAWFATSAGLVRWDGEVIEQHHPNGWRVPRGEPGLNHDSVTAIASGSERLWISDVLGPVSMASGEYWRRHRLSVFGTSYQAVAACGEQAWVASEDAGVSQWTGRSWRHHDGTTGLPDDWVMAVACEGGQAWAGTYRDGVWRWNGRSWAPIEGTDPWILSLAKADEGLYVGTMNGLYRLGEEAARLTSPDPRVHQITVTDEAVLVGTEGGLAVLPR